MRIRSHDRMLCASHPVRSPSRDAGAAEPHGAKRKSDDMGKAGTMPVGFPPPDSQEFKEAYQRIVSQSKGLRDANSNVDGAVKKVETDNILKDSDTKEGKSKKADPGTIKAKKSIQAEQAKDKSGPALADQPVRKGKTKEEE